MAWRHLFRRARRDADTAREIASYIAIETDDNIARGMTPQAAHDAAVRKFGNATRVREEIFFMNSIGPLDTVWQDIKFAARLLKRDKGFAVAAILSLALGIGANTAIFQLLDAVRLRTLPVDEPQQLVEVRFPPGTSRSGSFTGRRPMMSSAQFDAVRQQDGLLDGLFAWSSGRLNTAVGGEGQYVEALWASGDLFQTLRVAPVVGRLLNADDDGPGCGTPVAVLSHAYWQRAFGGASSVLGQTVRLEGHQFDIVGVSDASFFGLDVGRQFEVAIPLCADALLRGGRGDRAASRSHYWLSVVGRLAPGRTAAQVTEQLIARSPALMAATMPEGYHTPEGEKEYLAAKLNALPIGAGISSVRTQFGEPLVVLLAATGLVLLIACANLANLLLARATARGREIAVRLAIGASRARIVHQLFVESVLLAGAGALLGVVVARGITGVLVAQLAVGTTAFFIDLSWNFKVLGFTTGVSLLACLLFGLAPAIKATALTPVTALKSGGRGATEGRERFGLRRVLVVTQVALSLVLLIGALLFTRTLYNLLTIDAGFDQRALSVSLSHGSLLAADPARNVSLRRELQEALATVPGVAGVAQADYVPLGGGSWNEFVFVDGVAEKALANFNRVSGNYFETLGVPLVKGRTFAASDVLQSPAVAVVNEAFVSKLVPGGEPLGRVLWVEPPAGQPVEKIQIVGVVRNTKYQDIKEDFPPIVHLAASQSADFFDSASFVVTLRPGVASVAPALARRVAEVNPAINLQTRLISESVSSALVRERLMAALSGAFGALAGLLAAIGLYGVMSYTVTRRSNEMGIRLAMGAARGEVLRMVLLDAGKLVTVGLVAGVALGLGAANAASSLLFGLQPTDPATLAAAVGMLAAIGLAASYFPALRASRLDPMKVLRDE
ncbi:MAG: ADOP family duplicated permease [Vicinamibacterales bacterium]